MPNPSFREALRDGGVRGVISAAASDIIERLAKTTSPTHRPTDIYDEDWDILIVLDGCRFDHMLDVKDNHEFIDTVDQATAVATSPEGWITETFNETRLANTARTAYVTADSTSDTLLDQSQFFLLDEVWRYAWEDGTGAVRPRAVTDRAISVWRRRDPKRMVVHYHQPQPPFYNDADLVPPSREDAIATQDRVFNALRSNGVDADDLHDAYRRNLNAVLNHVQILLNTIDAQDVVITSNYGTLLGESHMYGHPEDVGLSVATQTPWVETTASEDTRYRPKERETHLDATDIDEFFTRDS